VKKFKMEPSEGAQWGRPLCFNFSSVEFSLVQLRGSFLTVGENDLKNPLSKLRVWMVVELADATTGTPFVLEEVPSNEIWRHTTAPRVLDLIDHGQGIGELSYEDKGVSDTICWHDISVPFSRAALRASVYILNKKGASTLVGRGVLPLVEVSNNERCSANKLLPSTTVSSVEPRLPKETELGTWLSLAKPIVQSGDSNGKNMPDGSSLDGPRTDGIESTFDPGSKGLTGDGLYLRVNALPAEHSRALPSRQTSMKGRNKRNWNQGAHPPPTNSNATTEFNSGLELTGEFC